MKKEIKKKQHDMTDCAAACLASIAAYYGLEIPISRVRQFASTDTKGTNVLGLTEAAKKIGFDTKAVKSIDIERKVVKIDPLFKIPLPAIAHMELREKKLLHYVVIYQVTKQYVTIMDPQEGEMVKMTVEDFAKEWSGILVLLMPGSGFKKGKENIPILQRILFLLKPHKSVLIQSLFGAVVYTILGLASSIYMQKIIDDVIPEGNKNLMNLLSITMILIVLVSTFISVAKTIFMTKTGMLIDTRLILGYYKHLLRLPQSFFDSMRSGEIISRIGDAVKIRAFINETLVGLTVNVFTVIFAFALMFTYYWKLATFMLLIIPLYFIVFVLYNRVNKVIQRRLMENAADLEAQLVESIHTAGTIKRFGLEEYADMKTESRFIASLRTGYRSGIYGLCASTSTGIIASVFNVVLLWSGVYFVIENVISPGELLSFYALMGFFIGPIGSLVGINLVFQNAKIAADRLFEIMDLDVEDVDDKLQFTEKDCGDIEFDNITFRYGSRSIIFKDFSVTFEKGMVSAIVGETGSGKTTLVSLLLNLYELHGGHIRIGGIDIKHIDNRCLRSLVGIVPQQVDLFEGSILDNIILDDFEPEWEKILEVCREVGVLNFIESLHDGFSTNIGENGVQLSGGQRQQLAIARVLYRDPEIIILDEATASLDSESEKRIKEIVNNLKKRGKTVLLIAHRLGTVMNSDRIYVLKNGVLVEEGNHRSLIDKNEYYANFWKSQTQMN